MGAETNLRALLGAMAPSLHPNSMVFCSLPADRAANLVADAWSMVREAEGVSLILDQALAEQAGVPFDRVWALITLTVHSSLAAVGFLAVLSQRLAEASISVNAISACYHDHLLVPWGDRERALSVLDSLSREARQRRSR